jgi:hypothetical protein
MSSERGEVSEATREAEAEEARAPHVADAEGQAGSDGSGPVEDQEVSDEVRSHYREMTEIGAQEKGEGQVP